MREQYLITSQQYSLLISKSHGHYIILYRKMKLSTHMKTMCTKENTLFMTMIDLLSCVKYAGKNHHESHPLLKTAKRSPSGDPFHSQSGKTYRNRKKTSNKTSLSSQRGGCGLMKAALPKQEAKR